MPSAPISVTCIGPFDTRSGATHLAMALGSSAPATAAGPSRAAALEELARQLPRGAEVRCDPSLAEEARRHGWVAAPLEPRAHEFSALAAIALMHGALLRKVSDLDLQEQLATAAAAYARARPWERFAADVPVTVTLSGACAGSRAALIFGQQGEEFGLTLYASEAQFQRFLAVHDDPERARQVDNLTCLTSLESGGLAEATRQAWGVPFVPHYLLMEGGRPQPLRADDARVLIACLRAVTAVARTGQRGEGKCEALGKAVTATLTCDAAPIAPLDEGALAVAPHALHADDGRYLPPVLRYAMDQGIPRLPTDGAARLRVTLQLFASQPGEPWVRRFLSTHSLSELPGIERWADVHLGGRLVLLDVLTARPGVVAARDLLLGESLLVHDVGLSRSAKPRTGLLGWLQEVDGQRLLAANRDELIPLDQALEAAEAVRERFGPLSVEVLRRLDVGEALIGATQPEPPPSGQPRNTDQHVIAFGVDRYRVKGGCAALEERLAGLPDVLAEGGGTFTVTKRGNAMHPTWRRTVVAALEVRGETLEVRANSTERLDATRAWLAREGGADLAFLERRKEDVRLPDAAVHLDAQPLADGPWGAVLPLLEQRTLLWREHGAALMGTDEGRREEACRAVHKAIAHASNQDGLLLGRALGVSSRGAWLGPDHRWLALGGGLPLSMVLQLLVAPVLGELGGDQRAALCDAMRLGWAVWEARATRAPRSAQATAVLAALAPSGRSRREKKDGTIEQRLPASSPNAALPPELVSWVLERAETMFPWDLRRVLSVQVVAGAGRLNTQVQWALEPTLARELSPLGYRADARPLQRYEDLQVGEQFGWAVTPPAWRRELIADWLARSQGPLDADFDTVVERRLALETAIFADQAGVARKACQELEALGLSHLEAVRRLMSVKLGERDTPRLLQQTVDAVRDQTGRRH